MRVFVTGLGGELGTRVALLLEQERSVKAVAGIDLDPPRRRLRRTGFTRIDPRDRARTAAAIRAFRPTSVVHLGVYEPDARCGPRAARERTVQISWPLAAPPVSMVGGGREGGPERPC